MSAREAENGFVGERFVSSERARRNIRDEIENDFNAVKIGGFQPSESSASQMIVVPAWRERQSYCA
jgi:hypothetical protein